MELFLIALLVVLALAWLLARSRRPSQRSDGGGDSGHGGDSGSACDSSDGGCGDGGGGGD
ncbi:hypothetical protein [Pseudoxanthomonas sp. CF125]|uniref:hypothetical protein n=1 Tax=Pseudoxanthomonas sp. CF125 TaxID=1855303 RepID=UPI000882A8A8|nr:hypothetical protein [Pseudoxanthomonas sp. CF125]SDR21632.1 hypothetical protein SAMN05216569_3617 [Pseudoxanthomonas sp. CF125]